MSEDVEIAFLVRRGQREEPGVQILKKRDSDNGDDGAPAEQSLLQVR